MTNQMRKSLRYYLFLTNKCVIDKAFEIIFVIFAKTIHAIMKKILLIAILFTWSLMMFADTKQDATKWNTPQAGNPFIPGYFADPTIRKFGDTSISMPLPTAQATVMVRLRCGCRKTLSTGAMSL